MNSMDERTPKPLENTYCRAFGWVSFGGKQEPILPLLALKYFLILLLCLSALIGIVEYRLNQLAGKGVVVSNDWKAENEAINKMNYAKVKSDKKDPVWRSDGIPPPGQKNGRARILAIGDSFVWGDGYVNINDTWWRQLERELRHRGYQGVDVVAAGINGISTQDQLRWFKEQKLIEKLEPDVVILGYVTNDPDVRNFLGVSNVKQLGSDLFVGGLRVILNRTLGTVAPNLNTQLIEHLTHKVQSKPTNDAFPYEEWELKILEPPNIDAYKEIVHDMGQFVQAKKVPFFVVTLPNKPSKEFFEQRYGPIRPIFKSAGLHFYDLLDDFIKEYPNNNNNGSSELKWGINPANGHPGKVSTRFYARKIGDILEHDYPHLLGKKADAATLTVGQINDWMPPNSHVRQINANEWEFTFPKKSDTAPLLPLGKPHMILSFAQPVSIQYVKITGAKLRESDLYATEVDTGTGIEAEENLALGAKSGNNAEWSPAAPAHWQGVNTLKLAAQFDDSADSAEDRTLNIHIDF